MKALRSGKLRGGLITEEKPRRITETPELSSNVHMNQGFKISAELRFWIVNKEISLRIPEEVIMSKYNIKPVFDLGTDVLRIPAEKIK